MTIVFKTVEVVKEEGGVIEEEIFNLLLSFPARVRIYNDSPLLPR